MAERQRREWERIAHRQRAVRFEELRRLLELSGWTLDRVHGSHHVFKKGGATISVPLRRPHVLPVYVRQVLDLTRPVVEEDDGRQDADAE